MAYEGARLAAEDAVQAGRGAAGQLKGSKRLPARYHSLIAVDTLP